MKIIFLDIDGVLNRHILQDNGCCSIEKPHVDVLNHVLHEVPEAKLVISSAWRYMILQGEMTLKGFEYLLLVCGVDCKDRVLDLTTSDEKIPRRDDQVQNWLADHLNVTHHVILDDLWLPFLGMNFYKINPSKGLRMEDVKPIVDYLR